MTDAPEWDGLARSFCAERCAHYGEPPCWSAVPDEWPNPDCGDPGGCQTLAKIAFAGIAAREREAKLCGFEAAAKWLRDNSKFRSGLLAVAIDTELRAELDRRRSDVEKRDE